MFHCRQVVYRESETVCFDYLWSHSVFDIILSVISTVQTMPVSLLSNYFVLSLNTKFATTN